MDKMYKKDRPDKVRGARFSALLHEAFSWLAKNEKLGKSGRHETGFARLCGTNVKTVRRWLADENRPQRDNWETARIGLSKGGVAPSLLEDLHAAWSSAPSLRESVAQSLHDLVIVPCNPFPKLCSINLDVPEQGHSASDFIIVGELRFARAPDVVDGKAISLGVRRAVLLPILKNCRIKPGSLYRPAQARHPEEGAEQTVFRANRRVPDAALEGDQLKGEMLGRFVATTDDKQGAPEVNATLQLEAPNDLCVKFEGSTSSHSETQLKVAAAWVAQQVAQTVVEPDGSLRIGSCIIQWKREG